MHRRVDRQVLPLGTWQSGQDSVVDLFHLVVQGCQYGAFRQVVWVLALLDKVRVDFIQQIVVLRHDSAEPLGDAQLSFGVEGKLALSHLEKGLRELLGVLVISHQGHSHVLVQLELVPLRPEWRRLEAGIQLAGRGALWYDGQGLPEVARQQDHDAAHEPVVASDVPQGPVEGLQGLLVCHRALIVDDKLAGFEELGRSSALADVADQRIRGGQVQWQLEG